MTMQTIEARLSELAAVEESSGWSGDQAAWIAARKERRALEDAVFALRVAEWRASKAK